ncbi:hypothetical protein OAK75_13305 [Bacteriovoracales bacterium]|nr:hypothetical protein [Bacteriovoracales bacterium]
MKSKIVFIFSFLIITLKSYAGDFWLPAQVVIMPDGTLTHNFPFPLEKTDSMLGSHGFGVWPSVVGSFNKFKRIVALDAPQGSLNPQKMVEGDDGVLRIGQNRHGYRIIQHKNWSIGLGLTSGIFGNGMLLPAVTLGVTGSYGKNVVSNRYIKNLRDEKRLPNPKIPRSKKDLEKWKEDDFLSWTTTKDVAFAVGGGFGPAAIGATVLGTSSFNMSVKKLGKDSAPYDVAVTMEKAKGKGWNINASIMVAGAAYNKMLEKAKSWTYYFDLDAKAKAKIRFFPSKHVRNWKKSIKIDLSAEKIYKEMLAGNLVPANIIGRMSKSNQKKFGVAPIDLTVSASKTKSRSYALSVPFLISGSYSRGKSFSVALTKQINDDSIGTTLLGVYNKEYETGGWLSQNSQRTRMFSGNYQKVAPINPNSNKAIQRRYSGSYKYFYTRNKVDGKKLKKELKYLERKVGFPKELSIPAPDKAKLGTIQIELDVRISDLATDVLMETAHKMSKNQFVELGMKDATQFFAGDWEYKDICKNARLTCQRKKTMQTKQAMQTAYNGLKKMKYHKDKLDYANFVKAYADFGRGFIKNRFTFKTILHLTRKARDTAKDPAVMINFKISGTSLPPYKKDLPIY